MRSDRVHGAGWTSRLCRHRRRSARRTSGLARSRTSIAAWPTWTPPPTPPRAAGITPAAARRHDVPQRVLWRAGSRSGRVLTRRTLETFMRNPLTLAILLASPVLVVGMFAILFRPGAFDFEDPSPSSMVMIGFWIVFAAFFFGLTYGLLQICTERTILRRERLVGLRLGAYVASKVTVLVPFLARRDRGHAGRASCARSPARSPAVDLRFAGTQLAAVRDRGARARVARRPPRSAMSRRRRWRCRCCASRRCCSRARFSPCTSWRRPVQRSAQSCPRVGPSRPSVTISGRGGSSPTAARHSDLRSSRRLATRARASTGTYWLILAAFAVVFLVATWGVLVRSTGRQAR